MPKRAAKRQKQEEKNEADVRNELLAEEAAGVAAAAAVAAAEQQQQRELPPLQIPLYLSPDDEAHFDHFLFYMLAYRARNNNYTVSKTQHPRLHEWMQFLKKEYRNYLNPLETSVLTEEQINVLEFLHIPLTSRGDEHWQRFYELLKQYKQDHGHVLVPRLCEIPGLGDWVTDQRRQYKAMKQGQASQMNKIRQEKLEELGFVWQVRNRPEWESRLTELIEYKEEHGDCKVPQHYKPNRALGKWVAKQREQYKLIQKGEHSFLTPYRIEKLESLGFVWNVRSSLDPQLIYPEIQDAMAATARQAMGTAAVKREDEEGKQEIGKQESV